MGRRRHNHRPGGGPASATFLIAHLCVAIGHPKFGGTWLVSRNYPVRGARSSLALRASHACMNSCILSAIFVLMRYQNSIVNSLDGLKEESASKCVVPPIARPFVAIHSPTPSRMWLRTNVHHDPARHPGQKIASTAGATYLAARFNANNAATAVCISIVACPPGCLL